MRATLNTLLGCILLVSIHSAALGQQEEPQSGTESKVEGHKAILGDWTISFELGENALDYNLKISEKEGQFVGVFVSPRSGNTYPGKSVTFKDGGGADCHRSELRRYRRDNDLRGKAGRWPAFRRPLAGRDGRI